MNHGNIGDSLQQTFIAEKVLNKMYYHCNHGNSYFFKIDTSNSNEMPKQFGKKMAFMKT